MNKQYTIGDFMAAGYSVYDVSDTFQPGGFLWHFVEIANQRPPGVYIQPYGPDLQYIVPIYQASYLIMNEEAVAWLSNTISDYMPPIFNPTVDMNTAIETPDDFTIIGGNETESLFNFGSPFNIFGISWNSISQPTIYIILLFVLGVFLSKKKGKKRRKKT